MTTESITTTEQPKRRNGGSILTDRICQKRVSEAAGDGGVVDQDGSAEQLHRVIKPAATGLRLAA